MGLAEVGRGWGDGGGGVCVRRLAGFGSVWEGFGVPPRAVGVV